MNTNIQDIERFVIKANGEKVLFEKEKLEQSLYNSGAKEEIVNKVVTNITSWLKPNVTTKEIYTKAFSLLEQEESHTSSKYLLKEAIYELGPTGYPFEKFIGYLFNKQGFDIEVGVVLDGESITHEMDVVATKDKIQALVECKYHKDQGKQVSIQVPLYVRSRVNDIIAKRQQSREFKNFTFTGWVITNTRFSSDSIKYGEHSGLKLMSWSYPKGNSLKETIEKFKVYPITILHHLTNEEKRILLEKGIVTCLELLNNQDLLKELNISKQKHKRLLADLKNITLSH